MSINRSTQRTPSSIPTVTALFSVAVLGLSGCSVNTEIANSSKTEETAPIVIEAESYPVEIETKNLSEFRLTKTVFYGKVLSHEAPIHVKEQIGNGSIQVVYTPVKIQLLKSYLGSLPAGSVQTLRIMGGVANGIDYRAEDAPQLKDLPLSSTVAIWGSSRKTVGAETAPAITPFFIYKETREGMVNITSTETRNDPAIKNSMIRKEAETITTKRNGVR